MKVALLHYSTWPEMGGVENVVRDQANMLVNARHEVKVLTGVGLDTGEAYKSVLVPELAPDFPLNKSVRAVLDRGQSDQNFSKYRSVLTEALDAALAGVDVTFVHNIFTMHYNLACTQALHDLAPRHKMIAWTHDLTADQFRFRAAQPDPAALEPDADECAGRDLRGHLRLAGRRNQGPAQAAGRRHRSFPTWSIRCACLASRRKCGRRLLALEIPWRDFVFLLPARVMVRKNIDFAIEVVKKLREEGRNPAAADHRREGPRQPGLGTLRRVFAPVAAGGFAQPCLFSSAIIFSFRTTPCAISISCRTASFSPRGRKASACRSSRRRCTGCRSGAGTSPLSAPWKGRAPFCWTIWRNFPKRSSWLEAQSPFRQQRRCRRLFDPTIVYSKYYEPLLNSFTEQKAS